MKLLANFFDGTNSCEKRQVVINFNSKRKMGGVWYALVEFQRGAKQYMPIDNVEFVTRKKINWRKIPTC
jgi:hypothetical protein